MASWSGKIGLSCAGRLGQTYFSWPGGLMARENRFVLCRLAWANLFCPGPVASWPGKNRGNRFVLCRPAWANLFSLARRPRGQGKRVCSVQAGLDKPIFRGQEASWPEKIGLSCAGRPGQTYFSKPGGLMARENRIVLCRLAWANLVFLARRPRGQEK